MNEKPVLQSPGEKLAGLRLASGRSLPELSEATKIPLPMLQAIESDEFHKISGDLYVKSFLRAYAAEVGVEAEDILTLYGNFAGEAGGSSASTGATVWQEEEVEIKRLGLPWGTIGIAAAGVILIAVTAFFLLRGDDQDPGAVEVVAQPVPEASEEFLQVTLPEESGQISTDGETLPDQNLPEEQVQPIAVQSIPPDPVRELPQIPTAGAGEMTIDGRAWPVVLRLECPETRGISLKKDADREFSQVLWPDPAEPLPAGSIRSGYAYLTRAGLVVFWGAEDHFSLRVDDPAGVKASVNGGYRDISGLGPGEEIILNDPAVINSNLPSAQPADRP